MGSAAASSKPKKNSGEDRRKRKNSKPRKRRRVSSSPSSYSPDPEDVPRRRRSSRRKSDKRRGKDPKRSSKKKVRKARDRSLSSSSCDSGSSSDRSRSPVRRRQDDRKGKFKKVKRVKKLDGAVRSSRSRNRSLSCSTGSGRDSRSNSPMRMHSYRVDKNKEMDGSKQIGSSSVIESRGGVEERYENRGREMDSELNMENYGDLLRSDAGHDVERVEQAWAMDSSSHGGGSELDRWMGEKNIENDLYFDRFEESGTPTSELYRQLDADSDYSRRIRSEIVAADKHEFESDDLELMLRQKALENLNKLRGGLSSVNKATNDKEKVPVKESSEKPSGTATNSIMSKQSQIQTEIPLDVSNMNPVSKLPPMKTNYPTFEKKPLSSRLNESRNSIQLESSMSSQSTSNPLSIIENSPDKLSYRQSPCRDSLGKNPTVGCGNGNSLGAELSLGDGLASGNTCPNGEEKVSETNEIVKECQSGSQFEKKTFSRTHDGEVVQVSYKVYIPNKTPALARRKLQR